MTTLSYKEYKEQSLRDEYVNEALDFIDSESLNEEAVSAGVILLGALGLMAGKKLVQKYKDWKESKKSAYDINQDIELLQYKMEMLIDKKRYAEAQEVQDEIEKKMQKHKEVLVKGDKEKRKITKLHREAVSKAEAELAKIDMKKDLIKIKKKVDEADKEANIRAGKAEIDRAKRERELRRQMEQIKREIDGLDVIDAEERQESEFEDEKARRATIIKAEKLKKRKAEMDDELSNFGDDEADEYFDDIKSEFEKDLDVDGGSGEIHFKTDSELKFSSSKRR